MINPLIPGITDAGAGVLGLVGLAVWGFLSLILLAVFIALVFLLVRFLLVGTRAAQLYVARNSPIQVGAGADVSAGPLRTPSEPVSSAASRTAAPRASDPMATTAVRNGDASAPARPGAAPFAMTPEPAPTVAMTSTAPKDSEQRVAGGETVHAPVRPSEPSLTTTTVPTVTPTAAGRSSTSNAANGDIDGAPTATLPTPSQPAATPVTVTSGALPTALLASATTEVIPTREYLPSTAPVISPLASDFLLASRPAALEASAIEPVGRPAVSTPIQGAKAPTSKTTKAATSTSVSSKTAAARASKAPTKPRLPKTPPTA